MISQYIDVFGKQCLCTLFIEWRHEISHLFFFYSMIIPNVIFTWFKFNFVFHRNNIQNQKWVSLYLSQSDFQITYFVTVCFTICFSHVNTTSTELLSTLRVSPDTVKCHNSIQILFQLILINSHQFSLTLYLLSLFLAAP